MVGCCHLPLSKVYYKEDNIHTTVTQANMTLNMTQDFMAHYLQALTLASYNSQFLLKS